MLGPKMRPALPAIRTTFRCSALRLLVLVSLTSCRACVPPLAARGRPHAPCLVHEKPSPWFLALSVVPLSSSLPRVAPLGSAPQTTALQGGLYSIE